MFSKDDLERREKIRLERANVPVKFKGWEWDDLQPYQGQTVAGVKTWAQNVIDGKVIEAHGSIAGVGVMLWGEPGHGKTALASVTLQAILRASQVSTWGTSRKGPLQPSRGAYMTYYRQIPQLLQRQMSHQTSEEEDQLVMDLTGRRSPETTLRLLVLDDVGKEHRTSSGWAAGYLEGLLRDRYYFGWPTVVTTNLTPKDWRDEYGSSLASFIQEAFMSFHVESPVGDRRRHR